MTSAARATRFDMRASRTARAGDGGRRRYRSCDRRTAAWSWRAGVHLRRRRRVLAFLRQGQSASRRDQGRRLERSGRRPHVRRRASHSSAASTRWSTMPASPGPTGAVEDIEPADWRRCIDVDLTGQFLCARRAVPMLKAAGGGSIVNMSSAAGRHRLRLSHTLLRGQVRRHRLHAKPRQGARPGQYSRQRHPAGHHRRPTHGPASFATAPHSWASPTRRWRRPISTAFRSGA